MITEVHYQGGDGWPLFAAIKTPAEEVQGAAPLVLLHGGGPDHQSLLPLARLLGDERAAILPDIRGYGRSVCDDPSRHTWLQYADDIASLLDHLGHKKAILCGAGLGSTISLRFAVAHPERAAALVLISVEDIEDDAAKQAEVEFMEAFAHRARTCGLDAAWEPILPELAPVIEGMVRDAIPRSVVSSIAAAAAIGGDRSFRSLEELASIRAPSLIFPGIDYRHPAKLAQQLSDILPSGHLGQANFSAETGTAQAFANAFAPPIRRFLAELG